MPDRPRATWAHLTRRATAGAVRGGHLPRQRPRRAERNKTSSAVRLRHPPSGLIVIAEESRSQHENRARALRRMRQALYLKLRDDLPPDGSTPDALAARPDYGAARGARRPAAPGPQGPALLAGGRRGAGRAAAVEARVERGGGGAGGFDGEPDRLPAQRRQGVGAGQPAAHPLRPQAAAIDACRRSRRACPPRTASPGSTSRSWRRWRRPSDAGGLRLAAPAGHRAADLADRGPAAARLGGRRRACWSCTSRSRTWRRRRRTSSTAACPPSSGPTATAWAWPSTAAPASAAPAWSWPPTSSPRGRAPERHRQGPAAAARVDRDRRAGRRRRGVRPPPRPAAQRGLTRQSFLQGGRHGPESRRSFNGQLLGSLLTFGLVETLFTRDLFADDAKPMIGRWVLEPRELCQSVKDRRSRTPTGRPRSKTSTSAATCRNWSS